MSALRSSLSFCFPFPPSPLPLLPLFLVFFSSTFLCHSAQERHAHELLYPGSSTLPDLQPSRVRMVVFRDDRGVKVPLFDSQVHCDQEGEKVSQDRREGGREGWREKGLR